MKCSYFHIITYSEKNVNIYLYKNNSIAVYIFILFTKTPPAMPTKIPAIVPVIAKTAM